MTFLGSLAVFILQRLFEASTVAGAGLVVTGEHTSGALGLVQIGAGLVAALLPEGRSKTSTAAK